MAEILSIAPEVLSLTPKWLVLNKPAGWLTIRPSGPEGLAKADGVLADWAQERYGKALIVHRLDRETSGVVLMARTAEAHREASLWFEGHRVKKNYQCLAQGSPSAPVFMIRKPVRGQASSTQVELMERYLGAFLAQVTPMSGRRHQIRIHLSGEGFPILGDREYRGPAQVPVGEWTMVIPRVALHAARLELPSGERFEAPWPDDFASWVERLRKDGQRVS